MTLLAFAALALAVGSGDLPRSLGQAEAPQPRPQELTAPEGDTHQVFEFGRIQASARAGFAVFSDDFESDPQVLAGIGARVDWPWMSRDVFGFDVDRVGLYADLSITKIDRDLDFLENNSGTLFFAGFGADVNLYEDESCVFRGQAGVQYGHFGGVDDTDNGVAALAGLDVGVKIAESVAVVFNPQISFGNAGDQIYFINFGVQVRF